MHRIFGKKKAKAPDPTLDDAAKSIEGRGDKIQERIKKLDAELLRYKQQMKNMKNGPAKKSVQQRALRVLKQKKMYEKQMDSVYNQQFNIDQTKFAQDSVKETQITVAAMKVASKGLMNEMKHIDIDEIEDMQDEMTDMLEMNDEIQEIMGRSYGVPEELDEDDLMDELAGLEEEVENETDEVPSYLLSAASAAPRTNLSGPQPVAPSEEVDEFGLPKVPESLVSN